MCVCVCPLAGLQFIRWYYSLVETLYVYQAKCMPFRRLHVTSVILFAYVHALHSNPSLRDGRTKGLKKSIRTIEMQRMRLFLLLSLISVRHAFKRYAVAVRC